MSYDIRWAVVFSVAILFATTMSPSRSYSQDTKSSDSIAGKSSAKKSVVSGNSNFETITLRGRVVWMSEALLRRHGIREVPEAAERVLALETRDGHLHPLVEDTRGRAFRNDPRLRNMEVELLVRRYSNASAVQIIRLFELAKDGKYELDYWCDICSIAMVEQKECECCQAPNELRRQKITGKDSDSK